MTPERAAPLADLPEAVAAAVGTLAAHPAVVAITLGGSRAAGFGDPASDHDIEVFVDGTVPVALRRELARRFDPYPEIDNTWFGPADEWEAPDGTAIDIGYFDAAAFEAGLRDVVERHLPALGYTTAFWHTMRHATPVHDRDGWLAAMRQLAATPYPEPLRHNIVARNHPLLRSTRSSYRRQIALAITRNDPVSVNHRTAALLASVFDIAFALARVTHPGEKRQLDHLDALGDALPASLAPQVRALLRAAGDPAGRDVLPALDALCDTIDAAIRDHDLAAAMAPGSRSER